MRATRSSITLNKIENDAPAKIKSVSDEADDGIWLPNRKKLGRDGK